MVPGELEIPELAIRIRLSRSPVAPWMQRGAARAAALGLPLREGDSVTIRNRRPGDRLRPLGSAGSRLLKEILIDRRVPRDQRERLPLLCIGELIAWVPGVTIDHRFRIDGHTIAWVAEIAACRAPADPKAPGIDVRGERLSLGRDIAVPDRLSGNAPARPDEVDEH